MGIRYFSVCSGIESATVALQPLGWIPVGFAEIGEFPSAVLAHHYPDVPNHGDFTAIDCARIGPIDVLVGGTPCTSFSLAGHRKSLGEDRGRLTLEFGRMTHELVEHGGLKNAIWENVPGVLSADDNAFGKLLGRLVGSCAIVPPGEGWPGAGMVAGPRARVAWRVLDAQHFGTPQRRRRLYVVVDFGAGADPAAVLFERHGLPMDFGIRSKTAHATAAAAAKGAHTRSAVARMKAYGDYVIDGTTATLKGRDYHSGPTDVVIDGGRSRRLLPSECERLQGFPTGYTAIPEWRPRRKGSSGGRHVVADSPRYRAIGNAMPVPVMRWIGRRLDRELRRVEEERSEFNE